MCIENEKTITQKRILHAEIIGQIFNSEPKLQFDYFESVKNSLSKTIQTKQQVSATLHNRQREKNQHSTIQTRFSSKLSLSEYQLKEYHYFYAN